ncbi:hypothetical protein SCG7086_AF_00280 [Chlamydiales bacterium SCGC AG-110-P3]|nr:hypothetical protein SCG7086_AF_00280 [Chlamydiales bacterium SCGC AG-110-P3]
MRYYKFFGETPSLAMERSVKKKACSETGLEASRKQLSKQHE